MTIRLRCPQCQRKLKVSDAALGKKIQCPMCGTRFVGQIEPDTPPATPQPAAPPSVDRMPAPKPAAVEASLLDSLFADMAAHSLGPSTMPLQPQAAPTFTPLVLGQSTPKTKPADGEIIETISLGEMNGTEGTAPASLLSSFVAGSKPGTPRQSDTDSGRH